MHEEEPGEAMKPPRSAHRRILGAMATVGALVAFVKAAALLKEVVVARAFGTAPELDALRIAQAIPDFGLHVVAGSLSAALIPAYVELREREGTEAARRLFAGVAGLALLVLLGASVLLALASPWLVPLLGSGFAPSTLRLTSTLFLLLLPLVLLSGLGFSWAAVLNAHERYALPAVLPLLAHVLIIVLLLTRAADWGVFAIAFGLLAGLVLELLALGTFVRRLGLPLLPRLRGWTPELARFSREWALLAGSLVVSAGALLIDRGMAASLAPGSVARLDYGNKLVAGLLTVAVYAMAIPILPHFSKLAALGRWDEARATLRRFTRLVLLAGVPATLLVVALSHPLVRLLFERGAFTSADTDAVARIQQLYVLQVPGYVLMMLAGRLLMSLQRGGLLLAVGVAALAVNVAGNLVFMAWIGLPGIALSTALVQTLTAAALYALLRSALPRREAAP